MEFPDGLIQQYSANLIAESIYMECDKEGRRDQMMQDIVEYQKDTDALNIGDEFIKTNMGRPERVESNKLQRGVSSWSSGLTDRNLGSH